ncbi:MAG: GGDEF domain-containing protein [Nitrospirae bacterium]|nr:GGDEF domain-containing protein [Nitrospirota bacterium]
MTIKPSPEPVNKLSLFAEEETIIREAEELLNTTLGRESRLTPHFEKLLKGYKRLFTQTKRIVKMADNLQKDLNVASDKLSELCKIDQLTCISNRRCFEDTYNLKWKLSLRNGTPLAVIIIDIDFFKQFNDTYGHAEGDTCLHNVAQALKGALKRPEDSVARFGGEEFVAILPDTNEKGAMLVAEHIRATIETLAIPHCKSKISDHVTISLGVSVMIPKRQDDKGTHFSQADTALYQAKKLGRNRAVLWDQTIGQD